MDDSAQLYGYDLAGLYGLPRGRPPFLCTIGFSNDPEGEQDVTEFYRDETLHIVVRDAMAERL